MNRTHLQPPSSLSLSLEVSRPKYRHTHTPTNNCFNPNQLKAREYTRQGRTNEETEKKRNSTRAVRGGRFGTGALGRGGARATARRGAPTCLACTRWSSSARRTARACPQKGKDTKRGRPKVKLTLVASRPLRQRKVTTSTATVTPTLTRAVGTLTEAARGLPRDFQPPRPLQERSTREPRSQAQSLHPVPPRCPRARARDPGPRRGAAAFRAARAPSSAAQWPRRAPAAPSSHAPTPEAPARVPRVSKVVCR